VIDLLREMGYDVEAFHGSRSAPAEPDRFQNLRAWSYWQLRLLLDAGGIALAPDPRLREELLAIRYTFNKEEGIRLVAKTELRRALGRSTDRADAVVMALAAGAEAATIGGTVLDF